MKPIKIESTRSMSRKEVAEWLGALAEQLAAGGDVELEREGLLVSFFVPNKLDVELELEIEEGKTELEIELHW